MRAILQAV